MTEPDPTRADEARRIALVACGLDPDSRVTRAASYANETWIGDEWVLRVNRRGVGRLAREAAIVARLPREALHPGVRAHGNDGVIEWSLLPRVAGIDLGRAWVTMSPAQRERAIYELAAALAAVHATPCEGIADDIDPPHTLPLAPLLELIERVGETCSEEHRRLLRWLERFIRERWDAFDDRDRGLVHGDPHLENVLWDGEHVSALLDFEWSRPSWIHCDLEILLSICDDPRLFASADHEATVVRDDYAEMARWLRRAQPVWFEHPRLFDRLDILHASRALGHLVEGDSELRWEQLHSILVGKPAYRAPARVIATSGRLSQSEVRELVAHLSGAVDKQMWALRPFVEDPTHFEEVLRTLFEAGLSIKNVAHAVQLVAPRNGSTIMLAYAMDPRPDVRRDLFLAWGGPGEGADPEARFKPPYTTFEWKTDPLFIDLVHVGLADTVFAVRDAAARLAYMTQSGSHVTAELLANLASGEPSPWAAAALGTARDDASLSVLLGLVDHANEALAAGAIRGLAARPDGHLALIAALHDKRSHVRSVACNSFGMIATNVSADRVHAIEEAAATDYDLALALAYYRARHRT